MSIRPVASPAEDAGEALRIRSLSKTYTGTAALDDVDLVLRAGEVHALLGGNGSGKSTLVKVLAGVVTADPGASLEIAEQLHPLAHHDHHAAQRMGLRFVHQDLGLFPNLSVAENIALDGGFPGRGGKIRWKELHQRVSRLLTRLGIHARPDQPLGELRPADRTMVAVARALQDATASQPRVLCLDEVTAALPEEERAHLLEDIRALAGHGHAILMVTHRLDEVLQIASRVSVLRDGRLVAVDEVAGLDRDRLVQLVTGSSSTPLTTGSPPIRSSSADQPAPLELKTVSGGAARSVSLRLRRGEILGLGGLAGCGAADVVRLAAGDLPLTGGELHINGRRAAAWSVRRAVRHGIVYVPPDRARQALLPTLGLKENLTAGDVRPFWRRGRLRNRDEQTKTAGLLEPYNIKATSVTQPIRTLSGGNQQKTVLARWLHREPTVLLLDEPTQGVDVGARQAIHELIHRATSRGMGVLVTSLDAAELEALCDRVLVLAAGAVVAELPRGRVNADDIRRLSYHERKAS